MKDVPAGKRYEEEGRSSGQEGESWQETSDHTAMNAIPLYPGIVP
jgi:hypothetical protein